MKVFCIKSRPEKLNANDYYFPVSNLKLNKRKDAVILTVDGYGSGLGPKIVKEVPIPKKLKEAKAFLIHCLQFWGPGNLVVLTFEEEDLIQIRIKGLILWKK
jgi:hypothetical protein